MRPEGVREWRKSRRASLKGVDRGRRRVYRLRVKYPTGHDRPGWRPPWWHEGHDLNPNSWVSGEVQPCTVYPDRSCNWEHAQQLDNPHADGGSESIRPDNTFRWPSADRKYLSKSGAMTRARRLRAYGAVVEIEASNPITWPDETPPAGATAEGAETTPTTT